MSRTKIMMFIFIGSEALFFLSLIISYVYYSFPGGTLSPTASYLNIKTASVFTAFLIASSVTMEIAGKKHQQQKSGGLMTWLIITIIFGAVFLTGQMSEYVSLYKENVTISKNVFGSAFFTLTGFHGLHVFIGLIVLLIILYQVASGKFKSIESDAFEGATIYWHFVDGVWIVVFSVIYIGAFVL